MGLNRIHTPPPLLWQTSKWHDAYECKPAANILASPVIGSVLCMCLWLTPASDDRAKPMHDIPLGHFRVATNIYTWKLTDYIPNPNLDLNPKPKLTSLAIF